jgi:hypothetical protein
MSLFSDHIVGFYFFNLWFNSEEGLCDAIQSINISPKDIRQYLMKMRESFESWENLTVLPSKLQKAVSRDRVPIHF